MIINSAFGGKEDLYLVYGDTSVTYNQIHGAISTGCTVYCDYYSNAPATPTSSTTHYYFGLYSYFEYNPTMNSYVFTLVGNDTWIGTTVYNSSKITLSITGAGVNWNIYNSNYLTGMVATYGTTTYTDISMGSPSVGAESGLWRCKYNNLWHYLQNYGSIDSTTQFQFVATYYSPTDNCMKASVLTCTSSGWTNAVYQISNTLAVTYADGTTGTIGT